MQSLCHLQSPSSVNLLLVLIGVQAILDDLGGCLLSHSVHVPEHLADDTEVPDPGTLLDLYGNRGLDFIVDVGPRVAVASTVGGVRGVQLGWWQKGLEK